MSTLHNKIAAKLTVLFGREITPEDIYIHKGGNRTDIVRWSIFGFQCFSTAAWSARSDVEFTFSDHSNNGITDIWAIDKDGDMCDMSRFR